MIACNVLASVSQTDLWLLLALLCACRNIQDADSAQISGGLTFCLDLFN